MRTFFCIAPDPNTSVKIDHWCQLCWPALGRRIPVQNYHLTMAFLGDTDDKALQTIGEIFEGFSHASFTVALQEVGYWASTDVLWIGPTVVPDALHSLNKKCRQAANRVGARGGAKTFQPHLTLARKLSSPPSSALIEPEFRFEVRSLELWSSVRKSEGAQYSTLGTWELK